MDLKIAITISAGAINRAQNLDIGACQRIVRPSIGYLASDLCLSIEADYKTGKEYNIGFYCEAIHLIKIVRVSTFNS